MGKRAQHSAGVIDNAEIREFVKTSDISGLDFISDELPQQPDMESMQIMGGEQPKQQQTEETENQETETWQQNLMN